MQKKRFLCFILILMAITIFATSREFLAIAESEDEVSEELEEEVDKTIEDLELDEFSSYVEGLEIFYNGDVKSFISELTKGNIPITPKNVFEYCFNGFTKGFTSIIPSLVGIVLIAVLFSLVFGLTSNFMKKQTTEIVYFVCYASIITTVVAIVLGIIKEVKTTVETLANIIDGIYPPLITLVTALGGNASSGLFNPGVAVASSLVGNVVCKVVLPLFIASIVFCIAGNLSSNLKLDKLQSAVRFIAGSIMSVTFGGLIAYLSISGLIGGVTDTASIKATKYLVSSYVPVVGGYLSQGFELVRTGLVIVKNALGVCGVLAIASVLLVPAFKLLALTVGLKLTAGIIEPITDKRMSGFINGVAESARQLLGALLGVGFVFILTLSLLILSLNAI